MGLDTHPLQNVQAMCIKWFLIKLVGSFLLLALPRIWFFHP